MKGILPSLASLMLCASTLHSGAADTEGFLQSKAAEEVHAAVTDVPNIIDMSHADPKTWHSLPLEAQGYGQVLAQELEFPTHFISRPRPF
jgi:hypothetical protein